MTSPAPSGSNSVAMAEAGGGGIRIESSTSKEEGELSSDVCGDGEFHEAGSVSHSADCYAAPLKAVDSEAVNKSTQDTKTENLVVKSTSLTEGSSKGCQQTDHHSNAEKTRVPFVISFSDDDSASDSDETRHDTSVGREHIQVADTSRKLPASSVHKSQKAVEAKLRSAKASFSRAFVSGASKPYGTISRRGGPIRGYKNAINFKKAVERSHSSKFNVHINTRKQQLQDLRQLIAFRESQLKDKPSQQTNSAVPVKASSHLKRFCREASGDEMQCNTTEADKKRLKTGELQMNRLGVDFRRNMNSVDQRLTSGNCDENPDNSGKVVSQITSHHALLMPPNYNKNKCPLPSETPCAITKEGSHIDLDSFVSNVNVKAGMPVLSPGNNDPGEKRAADNAERHSMREMNAQDERMSMQKKSVSDKYLTETSHQDQVKAKVNLDDRAQDSALHAPDTGQQATMNNSNFLNGLDELSLLKLKNGDVKSLLDLEDLLDKELEEVQEHRRRCEIEERNALMAHRKAQRALAEASARCSQIYSRRELFSMELRCRMMENPNLFFTSRDHDDNGVELNPKSISNYTMHPDPASSRDMQAALDSSKQLHHEFGFLDNTSKNLLEKHVDRQNLVTMEYCVPDGSSFRAHKDRDLSIDVCQSDDEDGELLDHRSLENLSGKTSDFNGGTVRRINDVSERQLSSNGPQDSFLLEASLRSQLFEKLKMKKLAKKPSQNMELVSGTRNQYDDGGMKTGTDMANASSPESRQSNPEDVNKDEVSSMPLVQIRRPVDIYRAEIATPPITNPTCCSFPFESHQLKTPATILCPTIKSSFLHMKVMQSLGLQHLPCTTTDSLVPEEDMEDVDQSVHDGIKKTTIGFILSDITSQSLFVKQPGYYTCNFDIDASQPLCMYELRGKCNNDECSWQHIRDYACDNTEHDKVDNIDCQAGNKPETEVNIDKLMSKSLTHLVLAPPTYVVGSDILKHDSLYVSTTAQGYGNCWRKCFSSFFVLSSLCPTVSLSDEPFLYGTEARIEVHGGLTRQSSYFHSRNVTGKQVDNNFEDAGQSLEVALRSFYKEANNNKQRFEALNILSRAIETNQCSVSLWIVYLLIYYSNQKSIGKDDLFQCAVEYNKDSYELWILFINSRAKLDDRLTAYQAALSALSSYKYASNDVTVLASQYVLDISLQMMDNLRMSGNVGKAIEKILGLFSSSKNSDHDIIIIPCELCDKVVFWVCCLYLIVYKKLPDPIVHSFECLKEPVVFDWPDVQLTFEEKLEASSLTELAVDSLVLYMDHESTESEKNLKGAHVFAVNHVRCVSVLEGLDCSRKLLEKYVELYPSCVELVLMSARLEYHMSGTTSFDGFEDALRNWRVEAPGKQCIWNQYFECVLQSENTDFLKELVDRWIHESNDNNDDDDGVHDPLLHSACDKVFGMLNLSLYKRLQNDYSESRFALEHALKITSVDYYQHCLRELSVSILTDGGIDNNNNNNTWHDKINSVLDILNVSLIDERVLSANEPLTSRSFIQKIQKPTVQHLANKLLMPISANFYLMNTVVEIWSGVFQNNKITEMVDFIEAMMEVLPCNYLLAMSVCKLVKNDGSESVKSSPSVSFWATSLLVNALYRGVPVAPEYCWVEAVDVLHNLACFDTIWESFHKKALSVYPFSIKLWRSYLRFSESTTGCGEAVIAEAHERGIQIRCFGSLAMFLNS